MRTLLLLFLLSLSLLVTGCASAGEKTGGTQAALAEPAPEPGPQPVADTGKKSKTSKESKAAATSKGRKSEAQIRSELEETAHKLTSQAARTVRPSKSAKEVKKTADKGYVATYVEVDTSNVDTEMRPANAPGMYVGIIRYSERLYECRGSDHKAALAAPCQEIGKSNRTEMIMFDGKTWHY